MDDDLKRRPMSERDKGFVRMRSLMDYGMGVLWMAMGVFMIFIKYFNTGLEARFDDPWMKAFGVLCLIYGSFRIYRGYSKNYYRPE